jgi:hypothetical protein
MLPREWCARCERCETVTPHARHRIRGLLFVALGLAVCTLVLLMLLPWPLALPSAAAALLLLAAERARHLGTTCQRCRWKEIRRERATWPDLRRTAFGR